MKKSQMNQIFETIGIVLFLFFGFCTYLKSQSTAVFDNVSITNAEGTEVYKTTTDHLRKMIEKSVKIYPNPANAYVTFDMTQFKDQNVQIDIFNQSGQRVKTDNVPGGSLYKMNIISLNRGMYIIYVKTVSEKNSVKLIVN